MSLVSIIIPVYNAEDLLSRCINSIINQSHSRIEIILINDGSTDNSGSICDHYGNLDTRIRVVHLKNKGVANARNKGIELAKGEYIQFVDSDDWLEEDTIEQTLGTLIRDKSQMIIFGYFRHFSLENYKECKLNNANVLNKEEIFKQLGFLMNNEMFNSVWNKLYKKNILMENNVEFNVLYQNGEDFMFNMEYIKFINNMSLYNKCFYHYNNTQQSLSKSRSIKKFKSIKSAYDQYRPDLENISLYSEQSRRLYEQYYLKNIFIMLVDIYRSRKKVNYDYRQILLNMFKDEAIKKSLSIADPDYYYLKLFIYILKSKNIGLFKSYLLTIDLILRLKQKSFKKNHNKT